MAEWVHIEDGQIDEYHSSIPANWRHVSGLNLSKDDLPFLKSLGWFPVTKIEPQYDPVLQTISEYNYEIRESDVVETAVLVDNPPVAPVEQEDILSSFLFNLRIERNRRLSSSDWTQLPDVQQLKDEEWKTKWTVYRQDLRNITNIYTSPISLMDIDWPLEPVDVV